MSHARRPADRRRDARLAKDPRDRHLRDRRPHATRHRPDQVDERDALVEPVAREEASVEPGVVPVRTPLIVTGLTGERTGEHAARQRLVDHGRDPQVATARDHRSFLLVIDQRQSLLDDVDRPARVTGLDIGHLVVGQADRADEPFVHEARHPSPGLRERHAAVLVRLMNDVDIDPVGAQTLQARSTRRLDLLGSQARSIWCRRDLRRDDEFVADADDRLADRRLVARVQVDLGGVEPVHAGIQRGRDDLAGTLDREVSPSPSSYPPSPIADTSTPDIPSARNILSPHLAAD